MEECNDGGILFHSSACTLVTSWIHGTGGTCIHVLQPLGLAQSLIGFNKLETQMYLSQKKTPTDKALQLTILRGGRDVNFKTFGQLTLQRTEATIRTLISNAEIYFLASRALIQGPAMAVTSGSHSSSALASAETSSLSGFWAKAG
ncbi:UNVERIFIED_CONTAM: hypothetical protein K2H54_043881 [Gekko kuhli]